MINLLSQAPGGTAEFTFDNVRIGSEEPLVLVVKPATSANAGYTNLRMRMQGDPRIKVSRKKATPAQNDAIREYWCEVFARSVVIGWRNFFDDGKDVPWSPEKALELLIAFLARKEDGSQPLVDDLDLFFAYCWNNDNFRGPLLGGAADLGKG